MLNEEFISFLREYLYETIPTKMLDMSDDVKTIYQASHLREKASSVDMLIKSLGCEIKSEQDVVAFRERYRRNAEDLYNESSMFPNGIVKPNEYCYKVYQKLLHEIDQFYMCMQRIQLNLPLLNPPYGEEKSFDSTVLSALLSTIDGAFFSMSKYRLNLQTIFHERGRILLDFFQKPQMTDSCHYMQAIEDEIFYDIEMKATEIRNTYAIVNQFAVKNRNRIEAILSDALKHAKYSLHD